MARADIGKLGAAKRVFGTAPYLAAIVAAALAILLVATATCQLAVRPPPVAPRVSVPDLNSTNAEVSNACLPESAAPKR